MDTKTQVLLDLAIRIALDGSFKRGYIYPEKNSFSDDQKKISEST